MKPRLPAQFFQIAATASCDVKTARSFFEPEKRRRMKPTTAERVRVAVVALISKTPPPTTRGRPKRDGPGCSSSLSPTSEDVLEDQQLKVKPLPILIGPANAEAVTGTPWRHVRDHARELGVPLLKAGRKYVVRADAYVAALEREQNAVPVDITTPADPAEQVRELLRRAGGR
jgi:hypothetical protein